MNDDVLLHIDGAWTAGSSGAFLEVVNPATEETILRVARARGKGMTGAAS